MTATLDSIHEHPQRRKLTEDEAAAYLVACAIRAKRDAVENPQLAVRSSKTTGSVRAGRIRSGHWEWSKVRESSNKRGQRDTAAVERGYEPVVYRAREMT